MDKEEIKNISEKDKLNLIEEDFRKLRSIQKKLGKIKESDKIQDEFTKRRLKKVRNRVKHLKSKLEILYELQIELEY